MQQWSVCGGKKRQILLPLLGVVVIIVGASVSWLSGKLTQERVELGPVLVMLCELAMLARENVLKVVESAMKIRENEVGKSKGSSSRGRRGRNGLPTYVVKVIELVLAVLAVARLGISLLLLRLGRSADGSAQLLPLLGRLVLVDQVELPVGRPSDALRADERVAIMAHLRHTTRAEILRHQRSAAFLQNLALQAVDLSTGSGLGAQSARGGRDHLRADGRGDIGWLQARRHGLTSHKPWGLGTADEGILDTEITRGGLVVFLGQMTGQRTVVVAIFHLTDGAFARDGLRRGNLWWLKTGSGGLDGSLGDPLSGTNLSPVLLVVVLDKGTAALGGCPELGPLAVLLILDLGVLPHHDWLGLLLDVVDVHVRTLEVVDFLRHNRGISVRRAMDTLVLEELEQVGLLGRLAAGAAGTCPGAGKLVRVGIQHIQDLLYLLQRPDLLAHLASLVQHVRVAGLGGKLQDVLLDVEPPAGSRVEEELPLGRTGEAKVGIAIQQRRVDGLGLLDLGIGICLDLSQGFLGRDGPRRDDMGDVDRKEFLFSL